MNGKDALISRDALLEDIKTAIDRYHNKPETFGAHAVTFAQIVREQPAVEGIIRKETIPDEWQKIINSLRCELVTSPAMMNAAAGLIEDLTDQTERLTAELAAARNQLASMMAELAQVKRERDAAVEDLAKCTAQRCWYCKNYKNPDREDDCYQCRCGIVQNFEWRGVTEEVAVASNLNTHISQLDLSVRAYNCLRRVEVDTVGDIIRMGYSKLTRVRNLGTKSLEEIVQKLAALGVKLDEGGANDG